VFGAGDRDATRRFALVGDSHTIHWRAALAVVARAEHWRGYSLTGVGCFFSAVVASFFAPCQSYYDDTLRFFQEHPEIDTAFMTSNADTPVDVAPGETEAAVKVDGFRRAWAALPPTVRHIVVLRDTPRSTQATFDCMARAQAAGRPLGTTCALARSIALRDDLGVEAVKQLHAARYESIDMTRYFCGLRSCYPVIAGARVNADGLGHLTVTYMRTAGPYLLREVRRLEAGWKPAIDPRPPAAP
jgi:hypothetical protein